MKDNVYVTNDHDTFDICQLDGQAVELFKYALMIMLCFQI